MEDIGNDTDSNEMWPHASWVHRPACPDDNSNGSWGLAEAATLIGVPSCLNKHTLLLHCVLNCVFFVIFCYITLPTVNGWVCHLQSTFRALKSHVFQADHPLNARKNAAVRLESTGTYSVPLTRCRCRLVMARCIFCILPQNHFPTMQITHRPQSSSFLGLPYRILSMNPKKRNYFGA